MMSAGFWRTTSAGPLSSPPQARQSQGEGEEDERAERAVGGGDEHGFPGVRSSGVRCAHQASRAGWGCTGQGGGAPALRAARHPGRSAGRPAWRRTTQTLRDGCHAAPATSLARAMTSSAASHSRTASATAAMRSGSERGSRTGTSRSAVAGPNLRETSRRTNSLSPSIRPSLHVLLTPLPHPIDQCHLCLLLMAARHPGPFGSSSLGTKVADRATDQSGFD